MERLKRAISSPFATIGVQVCAWMLLALIAIWTLGPLADRPRLGSPELERFAAYWLTGFLFSASYGRPRFVGFILCALAIALELGQLGVPGRDAGIPDALEKMLGAVAGVLAATAMRHWAAPPPDKLAQV